MKFQLWKLGFALTWYENAVPQLSCDSLNQKDHCGSCAALQKLKNEIAHFALRFYWLERSLHCAFDIMLFVPTSAHVKQTRFTHLHQQYHPGNRKHEFLSVPIPEQIFKYTA